MQDTPKPKSTRVTRFFGRWRDRFPASACLLALALTIFTIADGVMTLLLLECHFEEANPAMRLLLKGGPVAFVAGKYALTVAGIPVLLVFRGRQVFVPWIRVAHVLPALVGCYVVLLIYQVAMILRL